MSLESFNPLLLLLAIGFSLIPQISCGDMGSRYLRTKAIPHRSFQSTNPTHRKHRGVLLGMRVVWRSSCILITYFLPESRAQAFTFPAECASGLASSCLLVFGTLISSANLSALVSPQLTTFATTTPTDLNFACRTNVCRGDNTEQLPAS